MVKNKVNHTKFAQRTDLTKPTVIEVGAEDMVVDHYLNVRESLDIMLDSAKDDKTEKKIVIDSIKMIMNELRTVKENIEDDKEKKKINEVIRLYRDTFPEINFDKKEVKASCGCGPECTCGHRLDDDVLEDLLEDYAERACEVIGEYHNNISSQVESNNIFLKQGDVDILMISVTSNGHVDSVFPMGLLAKTYPIYSCEFYQKYWKPIVSAIGHFYVLGGDLLISLDKDLPDLPFESQGHLLTGYNNVSKKFDTVDLSFDIKDNVWFIKPCGLQCEASSEKDDSDKSVSRYNELDYKNAIVRCVDNDLDSLFDRTGEVIQVIPLSDIIEIDVDFGRGLGVVRLTEDQIEIVEI